MRRFILVFFIFLIKKFLVIQNTQIWLNGHFYLHRIIGIKTQLTKSSLSNYASFKNPLFNLISHGA